LDGTTDSLLNEVRSKISFISQLFVERVPCRRVRRDAVGVGVVVPTEFSGTIRTVKELSRGFVEVVVPLIGNNKLDRRSSTYLHVSGYYLPVLIHGRVK
jgi:hypothetical protein